MSKNLNAKNLNASVLAFERKLANSDGLMYAGNWDSRDDAQAWQPIIIQEKSVRGTISNRLKKSAEQGAIKDPAKLNAEIENANLQTVDVAALPFDADTLKIGFTLRVLGNLSTPSACNNTDYQKKLQTVIEGYAEEHTFKTLAARYAENIANGRFLWRNRVGVEEIAIQVQHGEQQWTFNAHDFSLREFSNDASLSELSQTIEQGLSGERNVFLNITAFAKVGEGQEVFPSQELILDNGKSKKSKVLYQVNNVAALHSQKIGNALRTIDTWYPDAHEIGAIAVEPYGSVTNRGVAYRQPKDKKDFYSIFDKWIQKDQVPEPDQQHYVMAVLIRGGVFGGKD